jgi:hypothetical protein
MRIGIGLAIAALLWAPVACKRKRPEAEGDAQAAQAAQSSARVATTVHMGDPRAAGQLTSGFYDIEDGAWRWTGKQFAVRLGTPMGAGASGATLELHFTIPPVVIEKNQSVTLSGSVDGNVLPPQTYSAAGEQVYKRDVPASLLGSDAVNATFDLDKALQPSGADQRVLGVVATSVGLVKKP